MTGTPDFATKPTLAGELAVLRPFTAWIDATVMSVLAPEWQPPAA